MSLNPAVSFFTVFHAIARVLVAEPIVSTPNMPLAPEEAAQPAIAAQPFVDFWFATPDSPGAIAIGMAEGTRTIDGKRTSAWHKHIDPGNARVNVGTFSSQHTALDPDLADLEMLAIVRERTVSLVREYPSLSSLEYLAAADLSIQAQGAFPAFGRHLKAVKYSKRHHRPVDAIVEARVRSFYNPANGELEAAGFDNDETALRRDQRRRTLELQRKIRRVEKIVPDAIAVANRIR